MTDLMTMQMVLSALLLASGALQLLRRTLFPTREPSAPPAAALALYGVIAAALCLIITRFAGVMLLLPALLMLAGAAALAMGAQALPSLQTRGRLIPALLLGLWLAALLAATILLRKPTDTHVLLRFDVLTDMRRHGSVRPLTDVLLNAALFLPLGLLLPWADANVQGSWLNVLSAALLLTAAIEGLQLLFCLGQADVEDLAANVLGAMVGWLLQRLFQHRKSQQ